jgi:hypothetical protein
MRVPLSRIVSIVASSLIAAPAAADEMAVRGYFGLPLGGAEPFFGLRADVAQPWISPPSADLPLSEPASVDLRFGRQMQPAISVRGVRLDHALGLYASEEDPDPQTGSDFDWYNVAGIAVGLGLIAAIVAADNVHISACSGPNCPPEKDPKPDPAETETAN